MPAIQYQRILVPLDGSATAGVAIETGSAAECILAFAAKEQYDLIVIATHGYSGFKRWALGSVADKVLRASDHPVLVNTNPPGGV